MLNKKIMILGASILQLPAILKAKEMGLSVVAVDMNPQAIGFYEDDIEKEIVSTIDISAVLQCARKHKIDGIMTLASDMPIRTVAAVAKELNLIGISCDTALKATNKAIMRQALSNYGVPIPKFYKVSNKVEYESAVLNFSSEFIVKPADNSGSRGVFKVSDIGNKTLVDYAFEYSKSFSRSGDVVVEEYMSGPEVSVETLTTKGVCHVIQITDKLTTGAPHFVEMGHSQPSHFSQNVISRIEEVAKQANKAIGIENGPSHTEIIITSDGPKIVELGARLGGDCITTHLVPLSTGVDMVECCIKIALGEDPDISPKFSKGAAIRYFPGRAGKIVRIEGIKESESIRGVEQINIVHGVGETVTDTRSSVDRLGFVISQGKCANEAVEICEKAVEKVKFLMENEQL